MDGRKAADDVREKVTSVAPNLRTEVKEPRVLRFDPSAPGCLVCGGTARASNKFNAVELTNWSRPGAQSAWKMCVAWVGATGGRTKRKSISTSTPRRSMHCGLPRSSGCCHSLREPGPAVGSCARTQQERWSDRRADGNDQRTLAASSWRAKRCGGSSDPGCPCGGRRTEIESLALYNNAHPAAAGAEIAGRNTIAVVDGLQKALATCKAQAIACGLR